MLLFHFWQPQRSETTAVPLRQPLAGVAQPHPIPRGGKGGGDGDGVIGPAQ